MYKIALEEKKRFFIFVQYFLDFCRFAVKNRRKFTGNCLDSVTKLKMFSK